MLTVVKCTRLSLPSADGQVYVTVALGELNFEEVNCIFTYHEKTAFNLYPAKEIYLNFEPLEVVFLYRDPQLQCLTL